ncbi:Trehalase (plasmid) [Rubrobacter radiotolerans]|uniref:Mannosylglycerate hydrolase n=2 Tax=Rubrobacter radiotolerans TaxID=42256 RepID=MGH_RUBRA|nr:trehalase family glycosidase [Rubrobacter radiotolerans]AFC76324.1 mannosylglycerate hydrolase [Rubrobacter radiotolerans]AHY48175.1 Trehalase [Rubrobacter radiotolerans]MDX5895434.1 trehalase family glycosidase [Rubrobacter radiotolerans]SMC01812.1 Trehalase [Rubrobacter radiotolerans DSM 5868]
MKEDEPAGPKVEDLIAQAKMVLDFNWTGEYTRPGPRLYPHQWSWDSALIALGYARYAPDRAMRELSHLFDAQWKNGLLPQIVFNPDFAAYFPDASFWHADESPDAPTHLRTSGIVQPPVHATAVLALLRNAAEAPGVRSFCEKAFSRLVSWHDYLYRERDPGGENLVYIRHPWESGMDNSPMWDAILESMFLYPSDIPSYKRADTHFVSSEDRPESAAYDRFAYLVKLFAERNYDEARIREDCPFLVQDVLFNSLLCRAERDLAELARTLGEEPSAFEARARKTAEAINDKLWDGERGTYLGFDLVSGAHIKVLAAPNFVALYGEVPDRKRARAMLARLSSPSFSLTEGTGVPVTSYDRLGFGFSSVRYWRGPVWVNIDWFLMHGLRRYGYEDEADRLREAIVRLCREEGFYEYFDPTTGMGHGSDLFSWTAALLLDVVLEG